MAAFKPTDNHHKRNLAVNFVGRIATGLSPLIFVPMYFEFLGPSQFGLLGLYGSMLAVFAIFDLGMSVTVTRVFAVAQGEGAKPGDAASLFRIFELVYLALSVLIIGTVFLGSSFIATQWLKADDLPPQYLQSAIKFAAVSVAAQLVLGFYTAGLLGLNRAISANAIVVLATLARGFGGLLIFLVNEADLIHLFAWHALCSLLGLAVARQLICSRLDWANFGWRISAVKDTWRFSSGAFFVSLSFMAVHQTDKLIASFVLPLREYSMYALAASAAVVIQALSSPFFATYYPSLSSACSKRQLEAARNQYTVATQLIATLIIPIAAIMCLFPETAIYAWTGNVDTAQVSGPLLGYLGLGSMFHCLTTIAYAMQMANGLTRPMLLVNTGFVAALIPIVMVGFASNGAVGIACAYALCNVGYFGAVFLAVSRTVQGFTAPVLMKLIVQLLGPLIVAWVIAVVLPEPKGRVLAFVHLSIASLLVAAAAFGASPAARSFAWRLLKFRPPP